MSELHPLQPGKCLLRSHRKEFILNVTLKITELDTDPLVEELFLLNASVYLHV